MSAVPFVETPTQRRVRVFASALGLGGMFGAISGVFATTLSAYAYAALRGDSVRDAVHFPGIVLYVPILATIGFCVGAVIGAVIGFVILVHDAVHGGASERFVRGAVLAVTGGVTLLAGVLTARVDSSTSLIARITAFCIIPGAFAIVLGQAGARRLIRAVQR
jgi:hypothetical protein